MYQLPSKLFFFCMFGLCDVCNIQDERQASENYLEMFFPHLVGMIFVLFGGNKFPGESVFPWCWTGCNVASENILDPGCFGQIAVHDAMFNTRLSVLVHRHLLLYLQKERKSKNPLNKANFELRGQIKTWEIYIGLGSHQELGFFSLRRRRRENGLFLLVHRYTVPEFLPQFFQCFAISLAVVWMQFIPQWEKRFAFGGHASWEKQFECHSKWSLFISLKAMQKRLFYQCKRYMRNARISLIVLPNTFRCCSTYLNKLPVYQFGFVQLMSLHC